MKKFSKKNQRNDLVKRFCLTECDDVWIYNYLQKEIDKINQGMRLEFYKQPNCPQNFAANFRYMSKYGFNEYVQLFLEQATLNFSDIITKLLNNHGIYNTNNFEFKYISKIISEYMIPLCNIQDLLLSGNMYNESSLILAAKYGRYEAIKIMCYYADKYMNKTQYNNTEYNHRKSILIHGYLRIYGRNRFKLSAKIIDVLSQHVFIENNLYNIWINKSSSNILLTPISAAISSYSNEVFNKIRPNVIKTIMMLLLNGGSVIKASLYQGRYNVYRCCERRKLTFEQKIFAAFESVELKQYKTVLEYALSNNDDELLHFFKNFSFDEFHV